MLKNIRYIRLTEEHIIVTCNDKKQIYKKLSDWISEQKVQAWKTDTGMIGSLNKITGKLIVKYSFRTMGIRTVETYENYYLLVIISKIDNGRYSLRYSFVCDRLVTIAMKLVPIVLLLPLIFLLTFGHSILNLFTLILFSVCAFLGVSVFFLKKEKTEDVEPVIKMFKKSMESLFPM